MGAGWGLFFAEKTGETDARCYHADTQKT